MNDEDTTFVRQLANDFPGVAALLAEHLEANFGEVLPCVFVGTFTFYLVETLLPAARLDASIASELRRILNRLEDEFANGSEGLRNLLAVSFLEMLPFEGEPGVEIREMLGPALKAELEAMGI